MSTNHCPFSHAASESPSHSQQHLCVLCFHDASSTENRNNLDCLQNALSALQAYGLDDSPIKDSPKDQDAAAEKFSVSDVKQSAVRVLGLQHDTAALTPTPILSVSMAQRTSIRKRAATGKRKTEKAHHGQVSTQPGGKHAKPANPDPNVSAATLQRKKDAQAAGKSPRPTSTSQS